MSKASFIEARPQEFGRDARGAIAIIFALTLTVVLMITGLAIETVRGLRAGNALSMAVDAAVLAGAKGMRLANMNDAEIVEAVTKMFDSNVEKSGLNAPTIKSFNVIINRPAGSVTLDIDAEIGTVLGGLAGVDKLSLPRRAVAVFEENDVEVAVQLDVTGSMGGSKIADLKVATKELVDILIPDDKTLLGGQKVRIGFAPFAAGVNAGRYASLINGGVSAPNSCVYERQSLAFQDSDAYPSGSAALKTKLSLPYASNCPNAEILPMTDDKSLLKSTVDGYWTGGSTAGHLGTAFAWYLLSPDWASIWPNASKPAAYGEKKTTKVAILMTDGEYNTVGGVNSGSNVALSADVSRETCAEMKAKGVIVYTVGFKLTAATAIDTLEQCASDANKFYEAKDGDALKAAFKAIAQDIATLRIAE
jgi:Flp pilus assembly protein TadG